METMMHEARIEKRYDRIKKKFRNHGNCQIVTLLLVWTTHHARYESLPQVKAQTVIVTHKFNFTI